MNCLFNIDNKDTEIISVVVTSSVSTVPEYVINSVNGVMIVEISEESLHNYSDFSEASEKLEAVIRENLEKENLSNSRVNFIGLGALSIFALDQALYGNIETELVFVEQPSIEGVVGSLEYNLTGMLDTLDSPVYTISEQGLALLKEAEETLNVEISTLESLV